MTKKNENRNCLTSSSRFFLSNSSRVLRSSSSTSLMLNETMKSIQSRRPTTIERTAIVIDFSLFPMN